MGIKHSEPKTAEQDHSTFCQIDTINAISKLKKQQSQKMRDQIKNNRFQDDYGKKSSLLKLNIRDK